MPSSRSSLLIDAKRTRSLLRIKRRFEVARIGGYVLDVGPRFILLSLVSDRLWFDGFECFRIVDIKTVKPDPFAEFAESALAKRDERIPRTPRVSLTSIEALLLSAGRAFPLITIHREKKDPDVCHIGRVVGVRRGSLRLLEIRPNATWERTPTEYRVGEITRVSFDGDYENALHLVGGAPKASR